MYQSTESWIDPLTAHAARVFLERVADQFPFEDAYLFGSRARRTHRPDSDADIALVLKGALGNRPQTAVSLAGVAFDVLLDTGVLVQALPLWHDEFANPEQFSNPSLIETIKREGIRL